MLPLLELVSDGKDHLMKDVTRGLANGFGLTEDERREVLLRGAADDHQQPCGLAQGPYEDGGIAW